MMNTALIFFMLMLPSGSGDIYKCTNEKNEVVHQSTPCPVKKSPESQLTQAKKQKNEEEKRRLVIEQNTKKNVKSAEEFKEFWEKDMDRAWAKKRAEDQQKVSDDKQQNDIQSTLGMCAKVGCAASVYVGLAKKSSKTKVEQALGTCSNQKLGKAHYLHCTVKIEELNKVRNGMIQLVLGADPEFVVDVNVY